MHFVIESQLDHLLVVVSESFDHAQMADALNSVFAASTKHGLRRIIIDITRLEGELSFMARFDFGRILAEFQREPVRIAVVANEDQVWPDRFAENVANNRGVKTKVSTRMAEALDWLRRDSIS